MSEGTRQINRLLVANRGEIARRVFRSCERLGVSTVAVYSEPDAEAPFVGEADEAVPLGGTSAAESYLRIEAVIAAAERTGADAIHPGYGFLAENAEFARAVTGAGLIWVGPPAEAIEAMGSKVKARAMMEEAGVPVLPGAELDATADAAAEAERVGFPLLVKASAGGGGKGMRAVGGPSELEEAIAGARREAAAAFGDDTVFLERLLERPRHIEIQVFADRHGAAVSLGERECSIQRRHQKVVEESPSPAVGPELRERMGVAAVAAAEAVGYEGAGTVEFLLDAGTGEGEEFFFLEMNTRLQVEHPVTEMVSGIDLVELQLAVASGAPLPAVAREIGAGRAPSGHAIEVRLYAEDPAAGFLPQTGRLEAFSFDRAAPFCRPHPAGAATDAEATGRPLLRIDSGVEAGSEVSPHYDPMLAKLIVWAPDRSGAARLLAAALRTARIHGPITNRDFLVRTLLSGEFLDGDTDTGFIERDPGLLEPLLDPPALRMHALAATLAAMGRRHGGGSGPLHFVPSGYRNNPSQPQRVGFRAGEEELEVSYLAGRDGITASVGDEEIGDLRVHALPPAAAAVDLEAGGVRRRYSVSPASVEAGTAAGSGELRYWVNSPLGQAALVELPRFPDSEQDAGEGALIAPMPGRVLKLLVAQGDTVEAGEPIAVLEAMKMEHELAAPASGVLVELRVVVDAQVDSGSVLGVIEPDVSSSPDP